jgi:hypothetical protein
MHRTMDAREALYNFFHKHGLYKEVGRYNTSPQLAMRYNSMYLLQDTSEALNVHLSLGFNSNPFLAYIEIWGVLQATTIHQYSITELLRSFGFPISSRWYSSGAALELQELRDTVCGHPARKDRKNAEKTVLRSFLGRKFGDYESLTYELHNEHSNKISHPTVNLKALIQAYDCQAAEVLGQLQKWLEKERKAGSLI